MLKKGDLIIKKKIMAAKHHIKKPSACTMQRAVSKLGHDFSEVIEDLPKDGDFSQRIHQMQSV